ncbi:hypothetical protein [Nonomuraea jiangxiensis]|uniref:Uncharacterized protein n=1 Tax=Nonomuraea jiangxiensis TaxID=633440 RepID=A0A1G9R0L8_9ACTN|nr:hypothetical protein [Nonomuraea jiangxiensis]SDM16691.1 hypothetical protein SAMN05421869_13776 [Nonomuraea jiangxiensis]
MSAPDGEKRFLYELHVEVEAEVTLAAASHPEQAADLPVSEWLFDPMEAESEEIGLRGLLDAVEVLEDDSPHG